MSATQSATDSGTSAAAGRLDGARFDQLTAAHGATDETARAQLVGVDRATLWRWRKGHKVPRLDAAQRAAAVLGVTVDELFPRRAA